MIKQYATKKCLLATLLSGAWLLAQPSASVAQTIGSLTNGVRTLDKLSGLFTVTSFQNVNGVSEATGILTAEATDSAGQPIDIFTNTMVKIPMPLHGALAGKASLLASVSEYIEPPTLSTNLCTILAVSIEFVDVVIPGLGLNVHLNQILLGVRADKDTRLGDVLCTILGEDVGVLSAAAPLSIRQEGNRLVLEGAGSAKLQSTTTLKEPIPWADVAGPASQTISPTGRVQFFRIAPSQTTTNVTR